MWSSNMTQISIYRIYNHRFLLHMKFGFIVYLNLLNNVIVIRRSGHAYLFIKERFNLFGDYEDFFDNNKDHNHLYHSVLSSSINIGLINPLDIIKIIKKYKSKISINSYEGYIRQLFWREYQRYCHIYIDFTKLDYFNNPDDLRLIKKNKINICLDTSHFLLSCNFYNCSPNIYFTKYG